MNSRCFATEPHRQTINLHCYRYREALNHMRDAINIVALRYIPLSPKRQPNHAWPNGSVSDANYANRIALIALARDTIRE